MVLINGDEFHEKLTEAFKLLWGQFRFSEQSSTS
jgi:hypothetical protein